MSGGLPVVRASDLDAGSAERRWLIEDLWAAEGVGIIGGEPKCCKSFLALDMAVAVAAAAPCLRRFQVLTPGRVLLYAAEDAPHLVRHRLEGICRAAGVRFEEIDIHVITAPTLRLDRREDQQRLLETAEALAPRLLVLDPFVRLHAIDENAAAEVASVLGYLRSLQRRLRMAVVLVHHARKGAAGARAGQALRGSSELHAWGDSNLYLRRKAERLALTIEHRAAAGSEGLAVELRENGEALALHAVDERLVGDFSARSAASQSSSSARVEQALAHASGPLTGRQLRRACRMRASSLGDALAALTAQGRVRRSERGYELTPHDRFPVPPSL
jgi:hypothetical protein